MMKNNTFYIPIKSTNLAHYFVKGFICPTAYIENRNNDVQDFFKSYILLSNKIYTDSSNCSLEIILDEKDKGLKEISSSFYLLDNIVPLSRVKTIYFSDEQQKINTTFNINTGAGFLSESLINIQKKSEITTANENFIIIKEQSKNDWRKKIDLFDRLMGGFSVMKLARNKSENYSENYFDTLSFINKRFEDELQKHAIKISDKFEWILPNNEKQKELKEIVYSNISEDTLLRFAREEGIEIKKENGIYKLKDEHSKTYLLSILASYGNGKRKSIDTFISDLNSNKFPENRQEGIALAFGVNNGYEAIRNEYKTANFHSEIKFKLDSILDFYTIESIYQFAFNNIISNGNFSYIDSWAPRFNSNIKTPSSNSFQILDKIITTKKKDTVQLPNLFHTLYQNTSRDRIYKTINAEINKYIPNYIVDKKVNEGILYLKSILEKELEIYSRQLFDSIENELKGVSGKTITELKTQLTNSNDKIVELEKEIVEIKKYEIGKLDNENKLSVDIYGLTKKSKKGEIKATSIESENRDLTSKKNKKKPPKTPTIFDK